ncbi:hypothetical protein F5880DRAFT_1075222 [Lentinula raphanica]|nr:hypothetical protein F5880DRAFT_1075222 [Lentinula raphanica]
MPSSALLCTNPSTFYHQHISQMYKERVCGILLPDTFLEQNEFYKRAYARAMANHPRRNEPDFPHDAWLIATNVANVNLTCKVNEILLSRHPNRPAAQPLTVSCMPQQIAYQNCIVLMRNVKPGAVLDIPQETIDAIAEAIGYDGKPSVYRLE